MLMLMGWRCRAIFVSTFASTSTLFLYLCTLFHFLFNTATLIEAYFLEIFIWSRLFFWLIIQPNSIFKLMNFSPQLLVYLLQNSLLLFNITQLLLHFPKFPPHNPQLLLQPLILTPFHVNFLEQLINFLTSLINFLIFFLQLLP